MRAILCPSLTGIASLELAEVAEPCSPGAGEALVAVTAVGLNFADTLMLRGEYQEKPALPFSPGAEIAGRVLGLGDGVDHIQIGDRVMGYVGHGGCRERLIAPAERLVTIPDGVDDASAAGLSVTYGTAIHALKERARLEAGEIVVVLGAAGGAGLAAVEIASLLGGQVIAIASSEDKRALCRAHGAALALSDELETLKDRLRAALSGLSPAIIYDTVGGALAEAAARTLAPGGRHLVVGFASGAVPNLPMNIVLVKALDVLGVHWGAAVAKDPASHRAQMAEVLGFCASRRLRPEIHGTFPLADTAAALTVIAERKARGKVVVTLA